MLNMEFEFYHHHMQNYVRQIKEYRRGFEVFNFFVFFAPIKMRVQIAIYSTCYMKRMHEYNEYNTCIY